MSPMRPLAFVAGLAGIGLACADPVPAGPVIPVGHPCPDFAFAPSESRLWNTEDVAPLALRLPVPIGYPVRVTQGNDGPQSHFGEERFAWDFGLELDTPVHAAAAGVVVWMEDGQSAFGPGPELRSKANFAVVDHGGGLFTSYVHLAAGSAEVVVGDVVSAGDVLARTGLSGQMTGPHLHFQVENVWSESVPARFAEPWGCTSYPVLDDYVEAWEVPLAESETLSTMPAEAFREDGVVSLEGLPARLLERGAHPRLKGRATLAGAVEVWFLVLPAGGGTALFAQRFPLTDGVFSDMLDLAEVAPGQYGIALVAGSGGSVSLPRSVRAAIIE